MAIFASVVSTLVVFGYGLGALFVLLARSTRERSTGPTRDVRAEIVARLATQPVVAIAAARDGEYIRVAGTVAALDPFTIDDGTGVAVVELDGSVFRYLFRGRYEIGQPMTVAAVVRRAADVATPHSGPFRDRPIAQVRLVSTVHHSVTLTDEVDMVSRLRAERATPTGRLAS